MFQQFTPSESIAPPLSLLLAERRVFGDWVWGMRENRGVAEGHDGRGHPVMVLPGFMVSD